MEATPSPCLLSCKRWRLADMELPNYLLWDLIDPLGMLNQGDEYMEGRARWAADG